MGQTSSSFGNSLEIGLLASADSHSSGLDELLQTKIIDTTSGQDHIGSGLQDFFDAALRNVEFS